jgi:hypothetical protein
MINLSRRKRVDQETSMVVEPQESEAANAYHVEINTTNITENGTVESSAP